MKSRKKIVKPFLRRSESNTDRPLSENKLKKKKLTSISLQQNLEYFQLWNNTPPQLQSLGDADRFFQQSLRRYHEFDFSLLRQTRSKTPRRRSHSTETLKKKTQTPRKPQLPTVELPTSTRSTTSQRKQFRTDLDELDTDIFYSPSSESDERKRMADEPTEFEDVEGEEDEAEEEGEELKEADEEEVADMGEEDNMKEVEDMIKQASAELEHATGQLDEEGETDEDEEDEHLQGLAGEIKAGGDGSIFKFDPTIDAAVLRELEEAEKQAKATATIIYELKTRVTELLKKETHTEAEAKELEQKNQELKAQMLLFEEKTKRIQFLIAQTNLFEKMIPPDTPLQQPHNEDVLPKVVVCGITENNIPKLILCDDKAKSARRKSKGPEIPMAEVPKFAKRLSDSYTMQERLAAENADLEGMRYKLQSDLANKDQTIEYLQRKLCTIQCEMRMLCKENCVLNEKIQQGMAPVRSESAKQRRTPCGKNKGPCPADIEYRLNEYSETTKTLEKQLVDMENDVKTMQTELTAVQAEREHMDQHKKILVVPPICHTPCSPCPPCSPCIVPCSDLQLRELREQYCRLQDDFKGKVTEVAGLRTDNERWKTCAKEAEEARKQLEEKVKELERTLKGMKMDKSLGTKEQLMEQEQQLAVAKQRFREAQDELEELRSFIQDQQGQLDDYRNKYLEAQQEVEEQRRRIDMMEMDANRVNEQVTLEIQRVKNQFQEKLQELLPLPDLLKTTQLKLQEAQQMHLLAERNNEALNRDLQVYKDKIEEITGEMDRARSDNELGENAKSSLQAKIQELEAKVNELEEETYILKENLAKTEEALDETERENQEKLHEIAQLSAQLENVREESARQVARNKERCETVRRSMQNQISDLERQLAQSRAQARAAQKDRDEVRQKMQAQINNLHENFEDAQMRIRNLQGHVNFLKETYSAPGTTNPEPDMADQHDACLCGRDF